MSVKALITNISRGSLHDGPGVRTVVYLKGCGLRCRWCHNPETLSFKNQLLYNKSKCIKCGKCMSVCPTHSITNDKETLYIADSCALCGKCVEVCPSKALGLAAKEMTSDEVFSVILKDKHYYKANSGGVTFSGGECLLNPDFVAETAKKCIQDKIHTAVESAFYVPFENVEKVMPYINLFFADLKISDPEKHRLYTGKDNSLIVENIRKLSRCDTDVIIRIPVIPGVNDSEKDFDGFAKILLSFGKSIKCIELLKYNNLASSKYASLGMHYENFATEPQTDERMEKLCKSLSEKSGTECIF